MYSFFIFVKNKAAQELKNLWAALFLKQLPYH